MKTVGAKEAKSQLARLLEEVEKGEEFTITKHGVPVAVLSRPPAKSKHSVQETIDAIREFRESHSLDGLSICEMINEGRRF